MTVPQITEVLKILNELIRIRISVTLGEYPGRTVGVLTKLLKINMSNSSHQLRHMRRMKVVRHKQIGQRAYLFCTEQNSLR